MPAQSATRTSNKASTKTPHMVKEPSGEQSRITNVESILSALKVYTASKEGLENLADIHHKIETLSSQNADLETANRVNIDSFAAQRAEWHAEHDALQDKIRIQGENQNALLREKSVADQTSNKQKDEIVELQRRLQDRDSEVASQINLLHERDVCITELKAEIEALRRSTSESKAKISKLQQDLGASREQEEESCRQLRDSKQSLATVQQFLSPLKELQDLKSQIRDALASLFNQALKFFRSAFARDLSDDILCRGGFAAFSIPLPSSNSPAARKMRVAAGLMICGESIIRHIFRRSFLIRSDEFDKILRNLAKAQPLHETYMRGVLPKVLPDTQRKNRELGIEDAIQDISQSVGGWADDEDAFNEGLRLVCAKASECSVLLEQVEDRIQPSFAFDASSDWLELPISSNSGQKKNQQKEVKKDNPQASTSCSIDIEKVIWPTFLAADPRDPEGAISAALDLVGHGYILTKSQAKDASDELQQMQTSHRAARASKREQPRRNSIFSKVGSEKTIAK